MTCNQFMELCTKYMIDPDIALENEDLVLALKSKDNKEIERILREEF